MLFTLATKLGGILLAYLVYKKPQLICSGLNDSQELIIHGDGLAISLFSTYCWHVISRPRICRTKVTKLSLDYVVSTIFSKMKVKLAVHVPSKTVPTCVIESGDLSVLGTAMFCQMINDLFDSANVRSTIEFQTKGNECIKPYETLEDCLVWMMSDVSKQYISL